MAIADKAKNKAQEAKGHVKDATGRATDDKSLQAEGKADAAIRLEQLWNEAGRTSGLDIFCGYDSSNFHGDEDEHVFHSICAEHSAVYSQ